jgi:hypothetical protein
LPASAAAAGPDPALLLVGLWIMGVAGAALVMACLQRRFMRRARAGAIGPAVVGLIAPRILTPRDFAQRYSRSEQALVLAHERAHIARQDSRLNGLCAAAQCLCWFNPLVHLAARLMRIDQELACDEAVVSRFPGARRAYAEVLVKTQLAILPLPLGCYWPSTGEHPLVERVAMLSGQHVGAARRSIGAAALAVLCAGSALAAWAAQPAQVRVAIRPAADVGPAQARVIAATPERAAAGDDRRARRADQGPAAREPVKAVAEIRLPGRTSRDAAAPTITIARNDASPAPAPAQVDAASEPSAQDIAPLQASLPDVASAAPPAARQPALAPARVAAVPPAVIKVSQKTGPAAGPEQVVCRNEAVTGSRFMRQVCMTRSDWREQQVRLFALERFWLLDPSGYSAADY